MNTLNQAMYILLLCVIVWPHIALVLLHFSTFMRSRCNRSYNSQRMNKWRPSWNTLLEFDTLMVKYQGLMGSTFLWNYEMFATSDQLDIQPYTDRTSSYNEHHWMQPHFIMSICHIAYLSVSSPSVQVSHILTTNLVFYQVNKMVEPNSGCAMLWRSIVSNCWRMYSHTSIQHQHLNNNFQ